MARTPNGRSGPSASSGSSFFGLSPENQFFIAPRTPFAPSANEAASPPPANTARPAPIAAIPAPTLMRFVPSRVDKISSDSPNAPPISPPTPLPMLVMRTTKSSPVTPNSAKILAIPPAAPAKAARPAPNRPILIGKVIGINAPARIIAPSVTVSIDDKTLNVPPTTRSTLLMSTAIGSPPSTLGRKNPRILSATVNTAEKARIPAASEPIPLISLPGPTFSFATATPPAKSAAIAVAEIDTPSNAPTKLPIADFMMDASTELIFANISPPPANSIPARAVFNTASATANTPMNARVPRPNAPIPFAIAIPSILNLAIAAPIPITAVIITVEIPSNAPKTFCISFLIPSPSTSNSLVNPSATAKGVMNPTIPAPRAVIPFMISFSTPFFPPRAMIVPRPRIVNSVAVPLIPSNAPNTFCIRVLILLPSIPTACPNFATRSPSKRPVKNPEIPAPRAVIPVRSFI